MASEVSPNSPKASQADCTAEEDPHGLSLLSDFRSVNRSVAPTEGFHLEVSHSLEQRLGNHT